MGSQDIQKQSFDIFGIFGSVACALHCLLLPVLSSMAPTISVYFENEWIHRGLVAGLVPLAFLAFVGGYKKHGKLWLLLLGVVGVTFLLMAVGTESFDFHELEKPLTLLGSILLVVSHVLNIQFSRKLGSQL